MLLSQHYDSVHIHTHTHMYYIALQSPYILMAKLSQFIIYSSFRCTTYFPLICGLPIIQISIIHYIMYEFIVHLQSVNLYNIEFIISVHMQLTAAIYIYSLTTTLLVQALANRPIAKITT